MTATDPGLRVDGATALIGIIGDPVVQVKVPAPLSARLQARGCNAVVVPMHVRPVDLADLLDVLARVGNCAGLIVTVPHKQPVARLVADCSATARDAEAVNVLRRQPAGWQGDLLDGLGFVQGLRANGFAPEGKSVAIAGAGGVGNAIAYALAAAGARSLLVHDVDASRRDRLLARLRTHGYDAAPWQGRSGAELLVNATPVGMRPADPVPIAPDEIDASKTVADVIMEPRTTALLELAASRGARVVHGHHMMDAQLDAMVDYFAPAVASIREQGNSDGR